MAKERTRFPASRIKAVIQSDDEVGQVSKDVPVVVSKVLELLVKDLVEAAVIKARAADSKMLHACYVKKVVQGDQIWDFLVEAAKDFPDEEPEKKPRGKQKQSDENV